MLKTQEPKYEATVDLGNVEDVERFTGRATGRLFNRQSGEPIPDDEPVFVFRARDVFASQVIAYYIGLIAGQSPVEHQTAVRDRFRDFERFASDHPERMKTPD